MPASHKWSVHLILLDNTAQFLACLSPLPPTPSSPQGWCLHTRLHADKEISTGITWMVCPSHPTGQNSTIPGMIIVFTPTPPLLQGWCLHTRLHADKEISPCITWMVCPSHPTGQHGTIPGMFIVLMGWARLPPGIFDGIVWYPLPWAFRMFVVKSWWESNKKQYFNAQLQGFCWEEVCPQPMTNIYTIQLPIWGCFCFWIS